MEQKIKNEDFKFNIVNQVTDFDPSQDNYWLWLD